MKKILVIAVFLIPYYCVAQNTVGAKYKLIEGVELHDEGKYVAAIKKYDEALALDVNNMDVLTEKALTLETMGSSKEAVEICKKTLKLYPNDVDPTLYVTYGNALDHLGQPDKALKVYKTGIEKFPDYYQLYFNQGITLSGVKKYEQAAISIQQATKINPNHPGSFNALGIIYSDNRIAAIMTTCRYLSLDNNSKRAKSNYSLLMKLLFQGVSKDSGNSISVYIDENILNKSEGKKQKENDFGMVDMILSMSAAMAVSEDSKSKTNPEKIAGMLETLISGLSEEQTKGKGYFYEYLAPYFIEMKAKNFLVPFSNVILITNDDKDAIRYYEEHSNNIKEFYEWSKAYQWK